MIWGICNSPLCCYLTSGVVCLQGVRRAVLRISGSTWEWRRMSWPQPQTTRFLQRSWRCKVSSHSRSATDWSSLPQFVSHILICGEVNSKKLRKDVIMNIVTDGLQVAVNRNRLGVVIERLLPDIEQQKEATEKQERDIEFAKAYFSVSDIIHKGCRRFPSTPKSLLP